MPQTRQTPHYDLLRVAKLVKNGHYVLTAKVENDINSYGYTLTAVGEALLNINNTHFSKSMESERRPGEWLDVYSLPFDDDIFYIKFKISSEPAVVVLSFKPDGAVR